MRNIALSGTWRATVDGGNITTTVVDLDKGCLWIASERLNADADVEVDIYKRELPNDAYDIDDAGPTELFSKLVSTANHSVPESCSQVISLKALIEEESLVAIMRGGDIASMKFEDGEPSQFEVIGSFEDGIQAAAWSPDDSLLILVTGEGKLIVMTPAFDVLHESALHTDEFGEDAPINVGWGSKQTQFHGSLGKAAAQAPSAPAAASVGISPDDDLLTRISWRGDGTLFAISTVTPSAGDAIHRRVLRVYNREGALQATAEAVPGLEHALSWRPSGNLIVGTQRFGTFPGGGKGRDGRHDVVFFEKNGLRHGEFGLRHGTLGVGPSDVPNRKWGYKVKDVGWSADSTVLSVWIEEDAGDTVQLWTIGNYHWYLKHEVAAPSTPSVPGRLTSVSWHPENALQLLLTTKAEIISRSYRWETCTATAKAPNDTGTVAVVDGSSILLTPFRMQNVPPPMSSHKLTLQPSSSAPARTLTTPSHLSFSSSEEVLAVLWESGYVELWNLHTRLAIGRGVLDSVHFREIAIWTDTSSASVMRIAALGHGSSGSDVLEVLDVAGSESADTKFDVPPLGSLGWRLASSEGAVTIHRNGSVREFDVESKQLVPRLDFGKACDVVRTIKVLQPSLSPPETTLFLGFTRSGSLLSATSSSRRTDVPSERRRVERGSRIVTSVPSATSLVLQMPRGNLETVNPRPMVMASVNADVDAQLSQGVLDVQETRIDLNVIVDRDPKLFTNASHYINLFLTNLGQGSQPPEIISELCDAVRAQLETRDLERYINSILTAYVVKRPSDLEAGLRALLQLRAVEDAVKYIIFLVDADTLFDVALGMYDFALVLLVAQHAQKDPREYLPFLRELRVLEKFYQRFRIDDHLKRYKSALQNLSLAGADYFDEITIYIEKHQLYETALEIYNDTEQLPEILDLYGDWLFDRREFSQAALVFVDARRSKKAMLAYEKALLWRELFEIAQLERVESEDIVAMAYRVAGAFVPVGLALALTNLVEDLASKKRYAEAGQVLLDYAQDAITLRSHPELLEEIIHPASLEARSQIADDLNEMREQLHEFYGTEDTALHNVDVMTDASAFTAFTRYTAAPSTSAASRTTKRSSRSKRKMERKVGSGRKGTVDEEEYLLKSLTKLAARLAATQDEAAALVPHLLQFTPTHRASARELQNEVATFAHEVAEAFSEAWPAVVETDADPGELEAPPADSWATRMAERERDRDRAVKAITKPELRLGEAWRTRLLDATAAANTKES
ncbi:IKI3 family-domain-containing protein [Gloeopeniophorella convolvens]|nr:IKI3 family-domain-containing protein [Gloeopeniophorella convolvens]